MTNLKPSGIKWIGDIPSDWNVVPINYVAQEVTTKNKTLIRKNAFKFFFGDIVNKPNFNPDIDDYVNKTIRNYILVNPGDIVINGLNLNFDFVTKRVGLVSNPGVITSAYISIRPNPNRISPKYMSYVLKTYDFEKAFHNMGGGVRKILNFEELGKNKIILPSLDIQTKITNFLDKKLFQINNTSAKIQQEIIDLEEYRQSIITKAVTKGIDKNVSMKDSGINWIGGIPQDFMVTRLKFLLETPLKYGANESGIDFDPNLPRYIRITDITSNSKLKEENKLSLSSTQAMGYILKNNTILFARSGATVGKTFLYKSTMGKAAFAGYLIAAKIDENKINPKWVYYYTKSNAYWNWVNQAFSQATIQNIGADKYSNLLLTVPQNKNLQNIIISKIDKINSKIDKIINKKQKLLEYLDKYRQSIIYEYVTGKKQVSNEEGIKA